MEICTTKNNDCSEVYRLIQMPASLQSSFKKYRCILDQNPAQFLVVFDVFKHVLILKGIHNFMARELDYLIA